MIISTVNCREEGELPLLQQSGWHLQQAVDAIFSGCRERDILHVLAPSDDINSQVKYMHFHCGDVSG